MVCLLLHCFQSTYWRWDVSNVTDMYICFMMQLPLIKPIGDWDVSNVTYMAYMFYKHTLSIKIFQVGVLSNIASEPTDFSTDSPLSESNKPVWGTCPTASVDDQNQLDISIYPNPTSDIVYIDGNYSQLKVVVYDILGKQVNERSLLQIA